MILRAVEAVQMKDSLLDIRALSARLCIPVGSIRNALWRQQAGQTIPAPIRLGRRLRWSEAVVEQFLADRAAETTAADLASRSYGPKTRGRPTKRSQLASLAALPIASDTQAAPR